MNNHKIGFIGGGNMATSLLGGLIADGQFSNTIWVSDPDVDKLDKLTQRFQINTCIDNKALVEQVDTLVFCVKPQALKDVVFELRDMLKNSNPLVVSIVAGIRESDISRWLNYSAPIVRTMPNTPALVQSAATVLVANKQVSSEQRDQAESLMRAVGVTIWIEDEALMDAVTALSGSGPAYLFLVMEMLEKAGHKLGLPHDVARLLTIQTAFGATKMALESTEDLHTLRKYVTSPGGTTEQAINVFQQGNIQQIFDEALAAAHKRSVELAEQLGGA
ncbi:MAG: pyrroline-5-carboxylate reductase [Gammaproteobacteria bacterium]|nr:pyrroline-5-carboxylate reductase [Gammaproteobacteria bacterium]